MKKPTRNIQYVIPIGDGWMVKSADRVKFSLIARDKKDAIAFAKEIAKNTKSDLVIYGKKMQILTTIRFKSSAKA